MLVSGWARRVIDLCRLAVAGFPRPAPLTPTNVAGQALVPTIVAKRNGLIDMDVYNGAKVSSIDEESGPRPQREPALAHSA